jgi:hypothetical protein
LESNQLEGEIPSAIGVLSELLVFSVHRNDLNGTMPEAFCFENASNETVSVTADCSEIDCPCCSFCCIGCEGDSAGDVVRGNLSPTSNLTVWDGCEPFVALDQSCYLEVSQIEVTFESCKPSGSDWIGMYRKEYAAIYTLNNAAPLQDEASIWSRSCGDQECSEPMAQNVVPLRIEGPKVENGEYTVFLVQGGVNVAMSDVFQVSRMCG